MDEKNPPEKIIKKERNLLKRILKESGIPEERQKALEPLIENVSFMKYRLDAAREELMDKPLTEEYTNGENQGGVKESSMFRAYENLWGAYMKGMAVILDAVPKQMKAAAPEAARPQTVLELVQSRRRKEA